MQNKGAIRLVAILLGIACLYQLSFTVVTRSVEKKAATYAAGDEVKQQAYLDSVRNKPVYSLGFIDFTYKECKDKELNLGLDLRGGMNVMLEISVEDIVRALSGDSKDPVFNQALTNARNAQKASGGDFITLFANNYAELSGGAPLAMIFSTADLKESVHSTSTNEEVIKVLRDQAESAIANSFNVLSRRIDRFGVTQPNIQRLQNSGRILVELPGVKEPERVRKLLQGTASLEFWATYDNQQLFPMLEQADRAVREYLEANQGTEEPTEGEQGALAEAAAAQAPTALEVEQSTENVELLSQMDSTALSTQADQAAFEKSNPLFAKLSPSFDPRSGALPGPVVGRAHAYDTATVNKYLALPQVRALLPRERDMKLMWGVKAMDEAESVFELYAIRVPANTNGKAPLDGAAVVEAHEEYSQTGSAAEVSMAMNSAGAKAWARLTADNVGHSIAIVLDGYVYSAPRVNQEITGGRSSITGNFTIQEAKDLANVLKSGKLPAPARIVQDTVVGPSLGAESINAGMFSFLLAFCLVLLYMWFFYNKGGLIANIALICNLFFLFGVLASFGAVLTLPGIAGIVLTMGMAVDANVIIYERIKEELRAGKGLSLAIKEGFSNAYSAIIDGQMTTLITGIVLFIFGTGPVQGFATTLIIGIITSLFSAIFITRLIISDITDSGKRTIRFSNKWTENFLYNTHVNFIDVRKITYTISVVLTVICLVSFFTRGFNYGVDFTGGRAYVVRFDHPVTSEEVREALGEVFTDDRSGSVTVTQFGTSGDQMRIVTQYMIDAPEEAGVVTTQINGMLYQALSPIYSTPLTEDEFVSTQTNPHGIITMDMVGAAVSNEITRNSIIAVVFSLLAIAIYIAIRFRKWQWGLGGVVSLAHDALLTMGIFSLFYGLLPFNLEVNQSFIAAILTIIGYSINDTVIIFDRIREYQTLYPKRDLKENINNAINSTLARTVNTAGTTLIVLVAIFLFGGEVIRGFVFALMFGIFVGTFSSIFVATPIAYDAIMGKQKKLARKA
ncbi:MAG: protein translocase subunit SecDF, partial [Rikenellaceae bacterium]|nr:protein translocase subunit SecDF [Rikenellaceae bacterium]